MNEELIKQIREMVTSNFKHLLDTGMLSDDILAQFAFICILEKLESIDEHLQALLPEPKQEEPESPFIGREQERIVCAVCGKRHEMLIEPGWYELVDISGEKKYFCGEVHMLKWKDWQKGRGE